MWIGELAASSSSPCLPTTVLRSIRSCTSAASGTVEIAAAARSLMRKAPPAKPISAARRWATVPVAAPSR